MSSENNSSRRARLDQDQPTLDPGVKPQSTDDETLLPSKSSGDSSTENVPVQTREFGDYLLVNEIARGGMGVVYRGRQKSLNRDVAIKMILSGQFASQEEVDRFYAEATAAAKLDHPNIVPVYDVGESEGFHYFSMKLIEGGDLGSRLGELRDDLPKAVRILKQVCDAVHHAHQRGILHRDLKPGNILLDADDQPYVTDLGLARSVHEDSRLTQTGAVIGTPSYMPPEQASGNTDITTAADIYSLGAILYELLAGRPPFQSNSPVETLMQVINDLPERPSSMGIKDRGLESICMKCLAKEPQDRYSSAADLSRDLSCWINGEPISVRATSLTNATKFWLKQNFGSAVWAVVIGPLMGIVSGLSLWYSTIGLDTTRFASAYEKLPSAQIPFSMSPSLIPRVAQVPLIILFLVSIVFVGFITARFVRPKHRGADLAAGTTVGVIASIAAFMFALGPLCVLTSLKYDDLRYSMQIALQEGDNTPAWILEVYPELEQMEQSQQIKALADKTETDHFFQIPAGIWSGAFVSLAIYFFPCLFETAVAGAVFRRENNWFRSLVTYLEITFPVVTMMVIVALAVTTYMLMGGFGFRWTIRMGLLFGVISFAIIAARMRWNVPVRVAAQVVFACSFLWFFATDFPSIPGVADCNRRVAMARRAVREAPKSFTARIRSVGSKLTYAEMLRRSDRDSESIGFLDAAIEETETLMSKEDELESYNEDTLRQFQYSAKATKVRLLIKAEKFKEAKELLADVKSEFPVASTIGDLEKLLESNR